MKIWWLSNYPLFWKQRKRERFFFFAVYDIVRTFKCVTNITIRRGATKTLFLPLSLSLSLFLFQIKAGGNTWHDSRIRETPVFPRVYLNPYPRPTSSLSLSLNPFAPFALEIPCVPRAFQWNLHTKRRSAFPCPYLMDTRRPIHPKKPNLLTLRARNSRGTLVAWYSNFKRLPHTAPRTEEDRNSRAARARYAPRKNLDTSME